MVRSLFKALLLPLAASVAVLSLAACDAGYEYEEEDRLSVVPEAIAFNH